MPTWIDTHCHWDATEFDADRDALREQARLAGVQHCVIPAVERGNWQLVRELAHRFGDSYALGIHPLYTGHAQEGDIAALDAMLHECRADPRLVAVGEIGLDFFVAGLDVERQTWFYEHQLDLARRHGLPVLLHVRKSSDQLLKALRSRSQQQRIGGIAHAFNGSAQQAAHFVALGFALGFGGALTYDRALHVRRMAQELPADSLVMETDAPDIPPHWLYTTAEQRAQGTVQGRNTPAELPRIAQALAQLRRTDLVDWQRQTTANACRVLPKLRELLHGQ